VLSADRIELKNREMIKLIGLKAPHAPKKKKIRRNNHNFIIEDTSPFITIEEKAFSFAKEFLENKLVRIEFDKQKKDEDFHTLAYVFLVDDNTFVNAEILRQGYANLHIQPPNTKYADELRNAYKEARKEKRGLQGD
jgi:endonuclease YncB( thermonuclease family)